MKEFPKGDAKEREDRQQDRAHSYEIILGRELLARSKWSFHLNLHTIRFFVQLCVIDHG